MNREFDPKKFRVILNAIRQAVKCPSCNGGFVEKDIEMIAGDKEAYFVKLSCSSCGLNLVASLVNVSGTRKVPGLKDFGLLFEDNQIDKIDKKEDEVITTDDVIDAHKFLANFEGRLK
jgi:uncharacterized protein with PIN domain